MNQVPVYIVAGGQSRRFGSDKARALIGGIPMIRRVADALEPVAQSVTAVAAMAGAYKDLGLVTIGDLRPGMGPMGGLDTALADRVARHGKGWLLLASCDLAEPNAALAQMLLERVAPNAQAVAFKGEHWEPLFALYHSNIRPMVCRQLDAGRLTMWRFVENAHPVAVSLPAGVTGITQINTRPDQQRYHGTDEQAL